MKPISRGNGGAAFGLRIPVDCGPQMAFRNKVEGEEFSRIDSISPPLSIDFMRSSCVIHAEAIESSDSARHVYNWIRNSLLHMCVEHRLSVESLHDVVEAADRGLWLHPDALILWGTDWERSDRVPILEAWSHMPTLFPDGMKVVMHEVVRGRPIWQYDSQQFLRDFEVCCQLYSKVREPIDPQIAVACQMFGNASRNTTQVSNYLSLVTILEILTPRPRASDEIRAAANELIELVTNNFPKLAAEDLDVLRNRIGEAKRMSIKRSLVHRIETIRDSSFDSELVSVLGIDEIHVDSIVTDMYSVRSQYVHAGYPSKSKSSSNLNFDQLLAFAYATARKLLLVSLTCIRERQSA